MSRVCLGGDGDLYSYDDDLADSNDFGRVVVISTEGACKNLDDYLANLKQGTQRQIAETQEKK